MDDSTSCMWPAPPQQQNHPNLAFQEFTEAFDLSLSREQLWMLTKAFIGSEECDGLSAHDRSRYIFFYEKLDALIEAVYLMQRQPAPVIPILPTPPAA
ncbi:hypothetical protein [Filimonas effusa]|uniref:Uncharacterized protein n=1 Tax=Filimonas effusa TaxID=2508721 RepID=A0A4Q1D274_9BACT|nr:hypothetical protein [Filimonas effusa]RXK81976.1 hypothetical protein ESB13_19545 [Filimonas effusa]